MKTTWNLGAILCLWTLLWSLEVEGTVSRFWKLFTQSSLSVPETTTEREIPIVILKGSKFHPTESYLYPTPPPVDKGFRKWEEEQEKKYAEEILAKLSSPNDTLIQFEAKALIANFLVNAAKDNVSISDKSITSERDEPSIPNQNAKDDLFFPYMPPNQTETTLDPTLEYQQLPTLPTSTSRSFDPIGSILNVISPNRNKNATEGGGPSPFDAVINVFAPRPAPSTTLKPGETTEYFLVPVHPATVPNSISLHQKDILNQVGRLRENVGNRNISGVIDESLKLASVQTIGVLLNGFLDIILCNPVDRWNGKCNEYH